MVQLFSYKDAVMPAIIKDIDQNIRSEFMERFFDTIILFCEKKRSKRNNKKRFLHFFYQKKLFQVVCQAIN